MKRFAVGLCLALAPTGAFTQTWNLGANYSSGTPLYFGIRDNYPLRVYTNDVQRMHVNALTTNVVNSQASMNRDGFVGIGRSFTPTDTWNSATGPYSLLHLNGNDGTFMERLGYRNWMRNGITLTASNDIMFIGPRQNETADVTDAVFAWGDNYGLAQNGTGPDNLIFTFMTGQTNTPVRTGDLVGNSDYGREILRLTSIGNVGIGPRFVNSAQPQSQLHINAENGVDTWLQITNQNIGQTAGDGIRFGTYLGTAYVFNQENAGIIFGSNISTSPIAGLQQERMRLTHIGAATTPFAPNPGNVFAANTTRFAISLTPTNPLNEPYSLVHIGTPTSAYGTNGIRTWMNVGYNTTYDSDNMFVGMKGEGSDRQDAIIAWGDNQVTAPDYLRFVFAAAANDANASVAAKGADGQEVARFTPIGQFGIGNFYNAGLPAIGATLDVAGDARIRTVTQNNALTQVLVRDPNDLGRVFWRDASTLGGGGGFGGPCGNASAATLTQNTEVPMGTYNFIFSGQDATASRVGIGTNCTPNAKLEVKQTAGTNTIAILGHNTTPSQNSGLAAGVAGFAENTVSDCSSGTAGGYFVANSSHHSFGVLAMAMRTPPSSNCEPQSTGGSFSAQGAVDNYGVMARGTGGSTAYGIYATATGGAGNWAAYINGDGFIPGGLWSSSDSRIKTGVADINGASNALAKLHPVSYRFDNAAAPSLQLPQELQYGVLAQELEKVFPNLVKTVPVTSGSPIPNEKGEFVPETGSEGLSEIKSVNYTGLIPVLIAAFQEQGEKLAQLQARLDALTAIPQPTEPAPPGVAVIQTRLQSAEEPSLGQNIPNPFDNATRIPVYLPQNTRKAELIFYGNDGRILQTLAINDRGNVWVDVNAEALAAGIYSYTLFTDGKPVETRKMVKQ